MKETSHNHKRNNSKGLIDFPEKISDNLDWWATKYFEIEVHTSLETQKAQKHDINLFLEFMQTQFSTLSRNNWTLKLTRNFLSFLRSQTDSNGKPLRNERTINRIMAHLKTFSKWIHKIQPFTLFNPMLKIKITDSGNVLDVDHAISSDERLKILEASDNLISFDAISKDKHRFKSTEKPVLKYKRPYRDRAVIYTLIETGMRRSDVVNINFEKINFKTRKIYIADKKTRKYQISKQGIKAIKDYIKSERDIDADKWQSPLLFLTPCTVSRSTGKLTPCVINNIWNRVCRAAEVSGKTPHSSRHAMGKYLYTKTGNPAAVKKQLGHTNPAYSIQYSQVSEKEIENILNDR